MYNENCVVSFYHNSKFNRVFSTPLSGKFPKQGISFSLDFFEEYMPMELNKAYVVNISQRDEDFTSETTGDTYPQFNTTPLGEVTAIELMSLPAVRTVNVKLATEQTVEEAVVVTEEQPAV